MPVLSPPDTTLQTHDDPAVQADILSFLYGMYPTKDVAEYRLNIIASSLHGNRTIQKLFFETGSGNNGKSTQSELISNAFGDYFGTMDASFLTRPVKSSSEAAPELADKKGKRYCNLPEPEGGDVIQASKMKVLTGYDEIAPRRLFKAPVKFRPQCLWTLQCNEDMPKFSKMDGGVMKRPEVFHYPFKFCHGIQTRRYQSRRPSGRRSGANSSQAWSGVSSSCGS